MNVRALVGPFDIAKWSIDHSAEHNSMGLEDLSHYGGGMSYFNSHCKKQNMNWVQAQGQVQVQVQVSFWSGRLAIFQNYTSKTPGQPVNGTIGGTNNRKILAQNVITCVKEKCACNKEIKSKIFV